MTISTAENLSLNNLTNTKTSAAPLALAVKGKLPRLNNTSGSLLLPEPIFSIRSDEDELERAKKQLGELDESISKLTKHEGAIALTGAAVGQVAGWIVGATAEAGVAIGTGFANEVVAPAAVGVSTYGAVASGITALSVWLDKKILGGGASLENLEKARDGMRKSIEFVETRAADAKELRSTIKSIGDTLSKLENAHELPVYELAKLARAFQSQYAEIQTELKKLFPTLQVLPGSYTRLSSELGMLPVDFFAIGVNRLLQDTDTDNKEQTRVTAFRRLWRLEHELSHGRLETSRPVYWEALDDKQASIRAEALLAMGHETTLRPQDFNRRLERLLRSKEDEVKIAALIGIEKLGLPSACIDIELGRLVDAHANTPQKVREQAERVLKSRQKAGIYHTFTPTECTNQILKGFVGTPSLQRSLQVALALYKTKINDPSNTEPNLRLRLEGEPGIGKTLLVHKLAKGLFGSDESCIRIDLSQVRSPKDLLTSLRAASPLSGKVVFFDELQSLDSIEDQQLRQGLIEVLKPFFNQNDTVSGLDLRDSVVALASNVPVEEMKSLDTATGKPLRSRITSYSESLDLQVDLKSKIDALVDGFCPYKYYEKEFPKLGTVDLDNDAINLLKQELKERYPEADRRPLNGRQAVAYIAKAIIGAKALHEDQCGMLATNEKGVLIAPLQVTVKKGQLALKQASKRK